MAAIPTCYTRRSSRSSPSRPMTIKSTMLTLSILLLSLSSITHLAQADEEEPPTLCSCSPTVFTFVLSLDQSCENEDIKENPGVDGFFCFTEENVAVPAAPLPEEEVTDEGDDEFEGEDDAVDLDIDLLIDDNVETRSIDEVSDFPTEAPVPEPVRHQRMLHQKFHQHQHFNFVEVNGDRSLQEEELKVVEIVSVQFLEFDTSGDLVVINQDDTYADVSLADGDRLKFASASSFLDTSLPLEEQLSSPALVPGGASLILYGKTESGVVVRNRFFWMYDMNCGEENDPVQVGDEIGWVTVDETANAWPVFCPALPDGSPTISPKTNEPTLSPSLHPTPPPTSSPVGSPTTPAPTMSMVTTVAPTNRGSMITPQPQSGYVPPMFSKSGKHSKTPKTPKISKSSKFTKATSSSSKSSKGTKGAKSVSSDDHSMTYSPPSLDGKSSKTAKKETQEGEYLMVERVNGAYDSRRNDSVRLSIVGLMVSSLFVSWSMLYV